MMNERNMKIVSSFHSSPYTPEKAELARKYCEDEICTFDFVTKAGEYMERLKKDQADSELIDLAFGGQDD